jgi:hypothetical protein
MIEPELRQIQSPHLYIINPLQFRGHVQRTDRLWDETKSSQLNSDDRCIAPDTGSSDNIGSLGLS